MRLRNNPKAINLLRQSRIVIQDFPFAFKKGTIIEMGMGKGEMITSLASHHPHNWYVGVEKCATVATQALKKAQTLDLKNFFIVNADIANLETLFSGKVQTIWLTFSDPWPKARHEKRRLTFKVFLNLYAKILEQDGVIKLKTDNDKFFNYSIASFIRAGWQLANVTYDFHSKSFAKDNVPTSYEIKWSTQGKKINYFEARK